MVDPIDVLCVGKEGWDCSILWIFMVLLFFIGAVFRKQVAENLMDTEFSLIGATVLGELVFIIMTFVLPIKFAFLIGFAGIIAGGFVGVMLGLPDGGYD